MPYNTTPIPPATTATGTANLPLARVKKILSADEDIASVSNNAAFILTIAAEMFIQYIVDQTHTVVKTERKQRRQIQYRDVANAVSRIDNLQFLGDVVPKTTTAKKVKEARKKAGMGKGQGTLDGAVGKGPEEEVEAEVEMNGTGGAEPDEEEGGVAVEDRMEVDAEAEQEPEEVEEADETEEPEQEHEEEEQLEEEKVVREAPRKRGRPRKTG